MQPPQGREVIRLKRGELAEGGVGGGEDAFAAGDEAGQGAVAVVEVGLGDGGVGVRAVAHLRRHQAVGGVEGVGGVPNEGRRGVRSGGDILAGLESRRVAGDGASGQRADGPRFETPRRVVAVGGGDAAGRRAAGGLARAVPGKVPRVAEPVGEGYQPPVGIVGARDAPAGGVHQVGDQPARVAGVGGGENGI